MSHVYKLFSPHADWRYHTTEAFRVTHAGPHAEIQIMATQIDSPATKPHNRRHVVKRIQSNRGRSNYRNGNAELVFIFLDMGMYHLQAFPELGQSSPGSPALQGLQIMQMLSGELSMRAQYFAPLSGAQVSLEPQM